MPFATPQSLLRNDSSRVEMDYAPIGMTMKNKKCRHSSFSSSISPFPKKPAGFPGTPTNGEPNCAWVIFSASLV